MIDSLLAMHMANELLSVPVAAVTIALAVLAVVLAAARLRRRLDADKLPLMGVIGAFVFAAQMINFTLPGMPGTSGHLGGGVLLAIVLGPAAGIVAMAAILIVQCLLFQDGGLLALGCNIINMGVVPCLLGWLLYRGLLGRAGQAPPWRQYLSAWAACLVGVTAGAALVPIQAAGSGVLRIPVANFLALMLGVHLFIGFFEGLITFAVIAYLRQVRPAAIGLSAPGGQLAPRQRLSRRAVALSLLVTSLLLAGVISWFASQYPDGLEWSYLEHRYGRTEQAVENPSGLVASVGAAQEKWSPMPDYTKRSAALGESAAEAPQAEPAEAWPNVDGWGSLAGVLGTLVTLGFVYLLAVLIRRRRPEPAKT